MLHTIEFYLIWLSSWSAGLVVTTMYDVGSLDVDGDGVTLATERKNATASALDVYFCGFVGGISLFFTVAVLGALHCWNSTTYITRLGRKRYMLIVAQLLKLLINASAFWVVRAWGHMQLKTGNDLICGYMLYTCECVSISFELSLNLLEEKSRHGIRRFMKTFAELTLAQMISAQLFDITESFMLYLAVIESLWLSFYFAWKFGNELGQWEDRLQWIGIGVGFLQALVFQRAQFKSRQEIINYVNLFVLSLLLPYWQWRYNVVEISPEYLHSYRKDRSANTVKPVQTTEMATSKEVAVNVL